MCIRDRARQEPLREEGYHQLKAAIRTLVYVTELLEKKETTLAALRELLCPCLLYTSRCV